MSRFASRVVLALCWFALCGVHLTCVQSALVPCGDTFCPVGSVCLETGQCAAAVDVAACEGAVAQAPCSGLAGAGVCQNGVCVSAACGNGQLDVDEGCDDGNRVPGDGCAADCSKLEVCGDTVVDVGEQCDDGNGNPVDGCAACAVAHWGLAATIGGPQTAAAATLNTPLALAVDDAQNWYVSVGVSPKILRVAATGEITTVAGTGEMGFSGDGGPASAAKIGTVEAIAVDGLGEVYFADGSNHRIRKVDQRGVIATVAGTGVAGSAGDGQLATAAQVSTPRGLALDGTGNLYLSDTGNQRVRRISNDGVITTIAGTGVARDTGDGGAATAAALDGPKALAVAPDGTLYVATAARVRRIAPSGTIATVAGDGFAGASGDGGPAVNAKLNAPRALALAGSGELYISDNGNHRVRRVGSDGILTTVAGTGTAGDTGDGGPAAQAQLRYPMGIAWLPSGRLLVVDSGNRRVREVAADGQMRHLAGHGAGGDAVAGRLPTAIRLGFPSGVAVASDGALFVAETFGCRVLRSLADGPITVVAGTGTCGYAGDGGAASAAQLGGPRALHLTPDGTLYIVETSNATVRKVAPTGEISTVAGTGVAGFSGEGGPANAAQLNDPQAVVVDSLGNVYIADGGNHRVRRVGLDGRIVTIAGTGVAGYNGDGGVAIAAQLQRPAGLAFDATGALLIADMFNRRIRRIAADGTIATIAGTGVSGSSGDGGPATAARLVDPMHIAVDATGRLLIADPDGNRVRAVALDGTIGTLAGRDQALFAGDGGLATAALLRTPYSVAADALGNIYIAEPYNSRVRRIAPTGVITTAMGFVGTNSLGQAAHVRLDSPSALARMGEDWLVATGATGVVLRYHNGEVSRVVGRYPHETDVGQLANFRSKAFGAIGGIAVDEATGTLYLTETSRHRVWAVATRGPGIDSADANTWTVTAVVNAAGAAGDRDGAAIEAQLREPQGLWFDASTQTLYIADTGNHAIRALALPSAEVSTVVNAAHALGLAGDGGAAQRALLYRPAALTRCRNGDFFVADTGNHRVRRLAGSALFPDGAAPGQSVAITPAHLAQTTVSTVLGDGVAASSGEGRPAAAFPVDTPTGLACDSAGNLFVTSLRTLRALPADSRGFIDGAGPVLSLISTGGPRTTFPASETQCLVGVAVAAETSALPVLTAPASGLFPALTSPTLNPAGHASALLGLDACSGILLRLNRP